MTKVVVSVVIPTFNEEAGIGPTLEPLQPLRDKGVELILADGGSTDSTIALAEPLVDDVVLSSKGRAIQMNAGAQRASGQWLLFLHADTQLPEDSLLWVLQLQFSQQAWGFFCLRLDGKHWSFRCIEQAINLRSRLTRVATGDQCIFVKRKEFLHVGKYPAIELMEDVALSKQLRQISEPLIWRSRVVTSSRRWQRYGIFKTVLLMWRLRLAYVLGASTQRLHRAYYDQ